MIDIPWTDDFAAARNACLDRVTGDWILWLDAGERIAPDTAQAIRRFVDEAANPNRVYLALVELPPTGEHQMVEQAGRVRLMPNKPNLRLQRPAARKFAQRAGRVSDGNRSHVVADSAQFERSRTGGEDAAGAPRLETCRTRIGRFGSHGRGGHRAGESGPRRSLAPSGRFGSGRAMLSRWRLPRLRAARPKCSKPIMVC